MWLVCTTAGLHLTLHIAGWCNSLKKNLCFGMITEFTFTSEVSGCNTWNVPGDSISLLLTACALPNIFELAWLPCRLLLLGGRLRSSSDPLLMSILNETSYTEIKHKHRPCNKKEKKCGRFRIRTRPFPRTPHRNEKTQHLNPLS
jgi:hypothetical protein